MLGTTQPATLNGAQVPIKRKPLATRIMQKFIHDSINEDGEGNSNRKLAKKAITAIAQQLMAHQEMNNHSSSQKEGMSKKKKMMMAAVAQHLIKKQHEKKTKGHRSSSSSSSSDDEDKTHKNRDMIKKIALVAAPFIQQQLREQRMKKNGALVTDESNPSTIKDKVMDKLHRSRSSSVESLPENEKSRKLDHVASIAQNFIMSQISEYKQKKAASTRAVAKSEASKKKPFALAASTVAHRLLRGDIEKLSKKERRSSRRSSSKRSRSSSSSDHEGALHNKAVMLAAVGIASKLVKKLRNRSSSSSSRSSSSSNEEAGHRRQAVLGAATTVAQKLFHKKAETTHENPQVTASRLDRFKAKLHRGRSASSSSSSSDMDEKTKDPAVMRAARRVVQSMMVKRLTDKMHKHRAEANSEHHNAWVKVGAGVAVTLLAKKARKIHRLRKAARLPGQPRQESSYELVNALVKAKRHGITHVGYHSIGYVTLRINKEYLYQKGHITKGDKLKSKLKLRDDKLFSLDHILDEAAKTNIKQSLGLRPDDEIKLTYVSGVSNPIASDNEGEKNWINFSEASQRNTQYFNNQAADFRIRSALHTEINTPATVLTTRSSYQPRMTMESSSSQYQKPLSMSAVNTNNYSSEYNVNRGSYQNYSYGRQPTLSTSSVYQPQSTSSSYIPTTTALNTAYNAQSSSYQPQTTSYQPQSTSSSYLPTATALNTAYNAQSSSYQQPAVSTSSVYQTGGAMGSTYQSGMTSSSGYQTAGMSSQSGLAKGAVPQMSWVSSYKDYKMGSNLSTSQVGLLDKGMMESRGSLLGGFAIGGSGVKKIDIGDFYGDNLRAVARQSTTYKEKDIIRQRVTTNVVRTFD